MKIIVDYKNGSTVPDEETLLFLKAQISFRSEFSIGSDLLLMGLRVLHTRGELDFNHLNVVDTKGAQYKINENGDLDRWSEPDIMSNLLRELMKFQRSKRLV